MRAALCSKLFGSVVHVATKYVNRIQLEMRCWWQDADNEDEDDPPNPDAAEMSDADLEELLKGLNIGTLSKSPKRSGDDLDEVRWRTLLPEGYLLKLMHDRSCRC